MRTRIIQAKSGCFQVVIDEPVSWIYLEESMTSPNTVYGQPMSPGSPLTRNILLSKSNGGYKFVWQAHHSVYDGWSLSLIHDRLQKLYRGLGIGHVTEYNQFIKHIESIKGSKGFWKAELQDAIPSHFPKTSTYRTRSSNSLRYKIDFSRRTDSPITTSTLIRAAWAVIVARYSNTSLHGADVCFGATLNGRNAPVPGIQEMLGTTITTVPIRVQFGHGEDVPAFLQRMQDQSVRMINHEHMGLQNIKSACPEAAAVLDFQNLLMVQPSQGQTEGSIFGWQAEPGSFDKHFHTYPLTMESFLTQSGATMLATFDSHIVTEKQMQRIMFQFDHGIQQLCMETPGALVTSLEVISQADKEEIQTWNKAPPTPVNCCVHILIEEEARKNPNAPAICSWDGDLSYHELDALASKLALEMVESGVGPETVVPLLFSKSLWTKVAMFAVMKAGGAFLMLDPLHPQSRLKSILHKVKPPILVSSPQHLKLARTLSHEVIVVSQDRLDQPTESVGSLPEKLSSSGTVYLIFTSGSSGEPKGICVSHQSLSTSTLAHGKAMKFTSRTRALQFTAYTFDVSLCEIITTLVHGGCICIPHENFRTSDVSREVRRMAVNWAFFTPSFVRLLDPASMPSLETLVLGGEKPSADNVKAWAKRLTLINGYGPSEASVFSVTNEMEDGTPPNNIGLAVGCSSWITEPGNTNQLAPIGAPGELCLAGPIVAKGYFNDPQRTATSFSEHSPQSSGSPIPYRSYMTGDIVQYDSFGKLLYLGRKDDQIKLRGYRIELGEIDHCLASSDRIKQGFALLPISGCCRENITAVLSLHDIPVAPGEAKFRLVSQEWVPIASGNISQIRERFFEILPSYMVPTVWIVVDNVPLLSSNKLDRVQGKQWVNQMTEEDFARVRRNVEESVSRMPTSMMEVRLQSVWSQILNRPLEETGVDNSFYSLGGDSISAMQVMVRARDEGIIFSVQDILQCRTISKLAPRARTNVLSSEKDEEEIFDIPFRLSPIQRTFFALSPHGENHFHQSFRLRFTQPFPDVRIASAIEAVIARHSMLRARFRENEGRWIQTMGRSVRGSYHFRSHEVADMKETRSIAAKTQTLIDIQGGLLFAVDLLRIKGSREQLLFMAAHHLVIDLVSWRIIIQDVEDYLRLGEFTSHVPVSFRKRCLLQQDGDLYSSEIFPDQSPDDHPAYWGITHDQNTYGNLTTDRFSIDEDTTNLLFGTCNAAFHTEPIDVLLATVLHSFGESFRDRALPPIFNESHGRQDSKTATDWSGTVGWFTTFQRVALENYSNNVEAVRSVKDFRRSAARHEAASSGHPNIVPHMEILLNYIGLFQGLNRDGALFLQVQDEELQDLPDISPGMRRFALFELSASLGGGKLEMSFAYPAGIRHQQQIKAWVSLCESGIKNVVNILSKLPVSVTLADFPLLSLDYPGLGKLVDITLPQAGIKDVHAVQDAFPCSPIQQGILISQTKHLDPYNIRFILNPVTDRDCDVHLLSNAWQKLMSWHECLRSIFVENLSGDGRFGQVVLREHHSNVLCMECEDESGAREALLNVPWSDYSGNSIPHKLTIAQHRAGITCMLDISHAVLDGTSIQLLLRDWARACCNEFGLGPQPAYSGYISHVLSQPLSSALEFWKEYLANMEPCHFPTNAVKCPIRTRIVELELPKWAGFRDFREKHEITSFAMFRAAWALVLRSYTSSDSVCFGFLTSGRELPVEKINEIIGPLANLLICRMDLKPADSLLDVLESMQNDYESVIPHQLCSLTDINDALGLPGDALFNTTISLQRPDHTSLESDVGIHFETIHAEVSGEVSARQIAHFECD